MVYQTIRALFSLRSMQPALSGTGLKLLPLVNGHILTVLRYGQGERLLLVANFSEHPQQLPAHHLSAAGLGAPLLDHLSGLYLDPSEAQTLSPYEVRWLVQEGTQDQAREKGEA